MERVLKKHQLVERSIAKKYRKTIWVPFIRAIKQYELIQPNDKVAVCISGGKDSMLLAKLMQELQKYSDFPFGLEFIVMDPGYDAENRNRILYNAKLLEIPVTVFETNIFTAVHKTEKSPCYLCARMRRGHLYSKAQKLGCNKIALGHHFSDVVETTLMGMLYGAQIQCMMPKLHSTNFKGMELIRPLYCIHEDDIIAWKRYNNLEFIQCACNVTRKNAVADGEFGSKRKEIKELIKQLKLGNKNVEKNIFNSIHSANLDTLIGYKQKSEIHNFLETY